MTRKPPPTDSSGYSKGTMKIIDKVLSDHSAALQARIAANKTPLQSPSDLLEVLDCQLGQRSGNLLSPERQQMYRDAACWMLLSKESQHEYGGNFVEFRRRFRMVTPKEVLNKYLLLTDAEQKDFLRELGQWSTAHMARQFIDGLSDKQKADFYWSEIAAFRSEIIPTVIADVIELLRGAPPESLDALYTEARAKSNATVRTAIERLNAFAFSEWKTDRDRKSKPETIRRNVEICDLRLKDSTTWTQGKLGKKFKLTPQGIRKILAEEPKWRQLAAALEH